MVSERIPGKWKLPKFLQNMVLKKQKKAESGSIFFLGMNPKKYKKLIDEVVGDEEYMPTDQVLQQNLCHCPDFANFHNFLSST